MGDEISLVLQAAVEFGAVGLIEIAAKVKIVEDPVRIDGRLRGAKEEPRARPPHLRQRLRRAVVNDRLEQTFRAVARPINRQRLLHIGHCAQNPAEGLPERRADDPPEVGAWRRRAAYGVERKAKAADDAFGGVGQRPVQIDEENVALKLRRQNRSFYDHNRVLVRHGLAPNAKNRVAQNR